MRRLPKPPRRISVIIPVLNEERCIADQLLHLLTIPDMSEVIVVDGGSSDRTLVLAKRFPSVRIIHSERGRALQMNAGAAHASGNVLLFLHADVALPHDAARVVRRTLLEPDIVAGAFSTWTVPNGSRSRLGPLLHLADLRSRYARLPYGDQAIFVRAQEFREVGGFPELPIMEDLALSKRLRKRGRIVRVPATVTVSGRRFQRRPVFYTILVNLFPALYRLGVPPRLLSSIYGNPR